MEARLSFFRYDDTHARLEKRDRISLLYRDNFNTHIGCIFLF